MNYCPQHDPYELLSKIGFRPVTGRGMVKDINKDDRLHAVMNNGIIEMHLDIYDLFIKRGRKRPHIAKKNTNEVENIIQKLKKVDNLKFYRLYSEL